MMAVLLVIVVRVREVSLAPDDGSGECEDNPD